MRINNTAIPALVRRSVSAVCGGISSPFENTSSHSEGGGLAVIYGSVGIAPLVGVTITTTSNAGGLVLLFTSSDLVKWTVFIPAGGAFAVANMGAKGAGVAAGASPGLSRHLVASCNVDNASNIDLNFTLNGQNSSGDAERLNSLITDRARQYILQKINPVSGPLPVFNSIMSKFVNGCAWFRDPRNKMEDRCSMLSVVGR